MSGRSKSTRILSGSSVKNRSFVGRNMRSNEK